jgi:hypothetical protein
MKPQELRIGNIVKIDDEYLGPIEGKVTSLKESGEAELLLSVSKGNGRHFVCGSDDIFPIPITDELLLKNGFEQCGYMFKTLFIEMYEVENGWHLHIDNDKFETAIALTIKHLHQLQNAYYLVTGKEFEIKL